MLSPITLAVNRESIAAAFWQNSLFLDFDNSNKTLDSRITFSRASSATYFDSTGTLQTASSGVARAHAFQDHDPSTLTPLGFLIEEQRTNSIRNNTMQGAVAGTPGTLPTNWSVTSSGSGLTREVVGTGTEDGIEYIDIKYSGTTSGATGITISFESNTGITAAENDVWTVSGYVKLIAGSWANTSFAPFINSYTAAGAFVANSTNALNVYTNPTSAALRTQRFTGRGTLSGATTARVNGGLFSNISSGVAIDFTVRIGLPQFELGAFATSVIKTTTAAATRLADSASITGTNFSSWFNATEGTIIARVSGVAANISGTSRRIFNATDGTESNRITMTYTDGLGAVSGFVTVGGVAQAVFTPGGATTQPYRVGMAYKTNDFANYVNGSQVGTDASGTLPTVNQLTIGDIVTGSAGIQNLNGRLARLAYYRTRLSNETLVGLTT